MRNLRRYARQTNAGLLIGLFFLIFIVGLGLIYIFYGPGSALTGLACLLVALIPVALIVVVLWAMDRFVAGVNKD